FAPENVSSREQFAEALGSACRRGKEYWQAAGLDLNGFNVLEAAADVEEARIALGYDSMILSGTSFGSHWGMAVLRSFPASVERAVLSGLEGPDHTWDVPSQILAALERIATTAEVELELSHRLPEGGLIGAWERVIERLEQDPVIVESKGPNQQVSRPVRLDGREMRQFVLSEMGSRYGIRDWPARVVALYERDYAAAAARRLRNSAPLRGMTASFFLMDGASGISRNRLALVESDPAVNLLGRVNDGYRIVAPIWGVDLGDEFRLGFETSVPTLLVQGTWDVNTPLENALELAPQFTQGRLVLVEGGSHAALREAARLSDDFRNGLTAFLKSGDLSRMSHKVRLPPLEWKKPR
ncbi:MAG: alpha/beta hydrolase, partial [Planctomycetota bacterium]